MNRIKIISGLAVVIFIIVASRIFICFSPYPQLNEFFNLPKSTRIYDCNGELVQILSLENGLRREFVTLDEISEEARKIFLSAEDKNFYRHCGIDFLSIFRAVFQNIKNGRIVSGASTVTMQLARMIKPAAKRNIFAKIAEAVDALRLEARLSKDEILELYLNHLPFGFNTQGVAGGARFFFGKDLSELSAAELCCLAVIPRMPTLYNPLENPDKCATAAVRLSDLSYEQIKSAAAKAKKFIYPENMPHYVRYLTSLENVGCYRNAEIRLAASLELQRKAENLLKESVRKGRFSRITNGAVLICDNATGEILSWVGSADFYDKFHGGQNDGVLACNQPGSSMKPFLYAFALESGFTPASVLPDVPMEFGNEQLYVPLNFNNRYNGPVRLRTALASSLNVPAVYLLNELGLGRYISLLEQLHFVSLKNANPGLGLALGNAEVSLFEMVQAFSVFPRDGFFMSLIPLQGYTNSEKKEVFRCDTARLICDILSDSQARYLGFGKGEVFDTPFPAIFKTGTANQFQNITALGATVRYTVGVWMGNFDGSTVVGKTGSSLPASLAKELLIILQGNESDDFKLPVLLEKKKICVLSGMPANENCPDIKDEFLPNDRTFEKCSWHNENDVAYPKEFSRWFYQKEIVGDLQNNNVPLQIVTPRNGSVFFYDSLLPENVQNIKVEVVGGKEELLHVFSDGKSFVIGRPFSFEIPLSPGLHNIRVKCADEECETTFECKK
ncbi:MAG: transglycosylase domain-containing protein [Spirochaetota bacterium]|nr:transglycosylase domain-containing protein [Spirochaetota bacterium]